MTGLQAAKDCGQTVCARLAALGHARVDAPRLLVVLAHPDDETIALGGRLEHLNASRFTLVTDGAPQDGFDAADHGFASVEAYAEAREMELAAVMRHAGLPQTALLPLTLEGRRTADKQARERLVPLVHALRKEIEAFAPEAILTHPYEGGHPDHDACAFAVHWAVRFSGRAIPVVEAPFYHRGTRGFTTGMFLGPDQGVASMLPPAQEGSKRARLAFYASQSQTLAQFGTEAERYRPAPEYDFTRPPHAGRVNYEDFGWGITGEQFCALAAAAQRELASI